jgi:hypothetical protein
MKALLFGLGVFLVFESGRVFSVAAEARLQGAILLGLLGVSALIIAFTQHGKDEVKAHPQKYTIE